MTFGPTDITLLIGAVSTAIASLFLVIQKSRCTTVKCFGVHCERIVDNSPPESLDAITTNDIESQLENVMRVSSPTTNLPTQETLNVSTVVASSPPHARGLVTSRILDLEAGRQSERTRLSDTGHG